MKTDKLNIKSTFLTILISLVTLPFISLQAKTERTFYYGFEKKIEIKQVPNKLIVKKKNTFSIDSYKNKTRQLLGKDVKTEWIGSNISKIELSSINDKKSKIKQLLSDNQIESVSNVYTTKNGQLELGFTNEIVLKFKDNVSKRTQEKVLRTFNLRKSKKTKIYQLVTIDKNRNVINVANKLYETGKFIFAYPNIICQAETSSLPNDTYFKYQVALHNVGQTFNDGHTGTYDADIDAPEAWDITTGNSNIIVAVFDQGVTSNHPDLPNTRQVRLNGSNFGSGNPNNPSPTGNQNHGNACAGVIGATMNNNEGITGIAPNCKIMPMRWDNTTSSTGLINGIQFAVNNGANIISNSWGYRTSETNFIPALVTAIQYAIDNNVIVVFAAGNTAVNCWNNDGYVTFPANSGVAGLITVGASDRYDKQSDYSPTSSLIDLVAPSHKSYPKTVVGCYNDETFEMWTLDIPGNAGYNPWKSNMIHPPVTGEKLPNTGTNYLAYTGRFGGTSHSCPVVAGVVALMLSVNPNLTPMEVYNILINSTDKIGGYNYINGRCDEVGFGRVNAFEAVQAACGTTYFTNQTVTNNTTVQDCNVVIRNVKVKNSAKLTVKATQKTIIEKDFEVKAGSRLEIK